MAEKIRKFILVFVAVFIVFWIGFKSGVVSSRISNKLRMEAIKIPYRETFFIVETVGEGDSKRVTYSGVPESDVIILFYQNEKLRPLLKLRDIQIYKDSGDRIY